MEITTVGMMNLIAAIIRLTSQDLKFGSKEIKKEANKFLYSRWFSEICDAMNYSPKEVRKLIRHSKVSWRNQYE